MDGPKVHTPAGHTSDQIMFNLSWDVEKLKTINDDCRKLYNELGSCINFCTDELFHNHNVPSKLTNIRTRLCEVVKRTVATHVFVFGDPGKEAIFFACAVSTICWT